jgi:uncharacterized protein (DUF1015 family)
MVAHIAAAEPDVAEPVRTATRPDGLVLAPFRALRYDTERIGSLASVTSPPYDVLDAAAVRRYEDQDPHNVVRLILPADRDGPPGSRYRAAAETLAGWRREGILRADPEPALYVYEEAHGNVTGRHVQRGLVGAVGLAAPEENIILPHENTMAGPVADRLALTEATEANLEPIFLVYAGGGAASAAVAGVDDTEPLLAATTADGVTHRVWALRDPAILAGVAADLLPRRAVIADGHHRYATYLRHQADRHAAGAGNGPWDYGLALLVDSTAFGPEVHAIHRVVPGLPLGDAVAQAATAFTVTEVPAADALAALTAAGATGPAILLASGSRYVLLTEPDADALAAAVPAERSAVWRSLDVTVAHSLLIARQWRLADTEDMVHFAHHTAEALAAADASGGTALLLNPTPVDAVTAVAAAGERMPRKSTLFTPKPQTGLLMRAFGDC